MLTVGNHPSTQSITTPKNEIVIKLWYKYGISVPFLTIDNHKKTANKCKYKSFL